MTFHFLSFFARRHRSLTRRPFYQSVRMFNLLHLDNIFGDTVSTEKEETYISECDVCIAISFWKAWNIQAMRAQCWPLWVRDKRQQEKFAVKFRLSSEECLYIKTVVIRWIQLRKVSSYLAPVLSVLRRRGHVEVRRGWWFPWWYVSPYTGVPSTAGSHVATFCSVITYPIELENKYCKCGTWGSHNGG